MLVNTCDNGTTWQPNITIELVKFDLANVFECVSTWSTGNGNFGSLEAVHRDGP